jgi:cell division septum initiation protein DivIVA
MEQCERLRQYNRWRRGEEDWSADDRGPDPKELGELIDGVADRLEVLEREHQQFFDRWHEERRRRERLAADVDRCYRMLLSEPDTKGALFKAENILREAIADASAKPHNCASERPAACGRSARLESYAAGDTE